ncbi:hypothetical protein ILUMI_10822 [Ignelater luminosus]|uniref:Serpin domain-containing protein n=1 Tax=Ignelater luminosus TaxID=2038154 RepID=A0A8K0D2L0_IGNLU|nr:hypothetical protein ILUMI_10822 [Ignelater luminosus]
MANTETTNVISGNAQFLNKFYTILSKDQAQGNVFFSPLSVHAALSMAYQGADEETEKQFTNTLQVSDKETIGKGYNNIMNILNTVEQMTLYMANKIFIMENYPLKKEFVQTVTQLFLSDIEPIDFEKMLKPQIK